MSRAALVDKHAEVLLPARREPAVASVIRRWRQLTTPQSARRAGAGVPTLVACSGGADSSFLVLALAAARAPMTVAHVLHDLRSPAQARADRDAVARLAASLHLPFLEAAVAVRSLPGNAEANARRLRYGALARLAREHDIPFIATAHHAHDQFESVLMALLRGSGPKGWRAIAQRRSISGVAVIRPMLDVTPDDARRLCRACGWSWREDATNADVTRLRNALRRRVLPVILELRPDAPARAATFARHAGHIWSLIREQIAPDLGKSAWPRSRLRAMNPLLLGELLRAAAGSPDRLPARAVEAATRLIRSSDTEPRALDWPSACVRITSRQVEVIAV